MQDNYFFYYSKMINFVQSLNQNSTLLIKKDLTLRKEWDFRKDGKNGVYTLVIDSMDLK